MTGIEQRRWVQAEVTPKLDPTDFTIASVPRRIARTPDPWADIDKHASALPR